MPTGPLPPSDNYLGDGDRTTGEFQAELNNLQNWARQFQAQLDALSSTTPGEAFNRGVGDSTGQLTARGVGTGLTQLVDNSELNTRLSTTGNLGTAAQQGYEEDSIVVNNTGDFTSLEMRCVKVGNVVTIHFPGSQPHSSTSLAISAAGAVPASFRPSETAFNVYSLRSGVGPVMRLSIDPDGTVLFWYINWDGSLRTQSGTTDTATLTFIKS